MKVVILGSGTSMGVPMIGCQCPVCRSDDIRDKRTRPGILLIKDDFHLLIDASAELRIQLLRENIGRIDSIIITHPHADHIFGLDDTRIFSLRSGRPMDIYASLYTQREIRSVFSYVFRKTQEGGGKPSFRFHNIQTAEKIGPFSVQSFKVYHGTLEIDAVICDNLLIVMDASYIYKEEFLSIKGACTHAIINGLRHTPHSTHFSISESSYLLKSLDIKQGYIMHMTHDMSYRELALIMPEGIYPAYDGLSFQC